MIKSRANSLRQNAASAGLALLLALSTACGKKDGGSAPPPPPPAPPVVAKTPVPDANGGDLDNDSSASSNYKDRQGQADPLPERPRGRRGGDLDPTGKTPEEIFTGRSSNGANGTNGSRPRGRDGVSRIDTSEPGRIRAAGAIPPGPRFANDLYYSGSGMDSLYEGLKAESNSRRNQEGDAMLAAVVGFTSFEVNWKTRAVRLSVSLERSGKASVERKFTGRLDKQLHFKAGSLRTPSDLEAEATCMDRGGGCSTVHVRLRQQSPRALRVADVIVRHTAAWIYSEGDDEYTGSNDEYDRFMHILKTSYYYPGGASSITDAYLNTSETINGSSSFAASMQMNMSVFDPTRAQAITWSGPLVKPRRDSELGLVVDQFADYNPWGRSVKRAKILANSIRDSRLVRNDGRGNLQIDVTFAKLSARATEQTARVTIARKHAPVNAPVVDVPTTDDSPTDDATPAEAGNAAGDAPAGPIEQ